MPEAATWPENPNNDIHDGYLANLYKIFQSAVGISGKCMHRSHY